MKTAIEFLCEEYEATPEDLQLHIALNPDVKRIERAMEKFRAQQPETESKSADKILRQYGQQVTTPEGVFIGLVGKEAIKALEEYAALRSQPSPQSNTVPTDEEIQKMGVEKYPVDDGDISTTELKYQMGIQMAYKQGLRDMRSSMLSSSPSAQ